VYYKHLKDFLEQSSQKAFWILSYGNIAGLVVGFLVARYVSDLLPGLPGLLLYPGLALGGLALTWVRQGQPAYQRGLLWLGFTLRRLLTPAALEVTSRRYYARPAAGARAFALEGLVSYSGDDADAGGPDPVGPDQPPRRPGRAGVVAPESGRPARTLASGDEPAVAGGGGG
jgi:hypothetical protein